MPEEILAISFTKKTVDELIERCAIKGVEFRTFHSLGKHILEFNEKAGLAELSLVSEEQTQKFLHDWIFDTMSQDDELSSRLARFILLQFSAPVSPGGFIDHPARIRLNQRYLRRSLDNILASEQRDKKSAGVTKSYRSKEDQLVADWLYLNRIDFKYLKKYPYLSKKEHYTPTFSLPNGVYLDILVTDKKGKSIYGSQYLRDIRWRRGVHEFNRTEQIEMYSYE